MSRKIPIDRRKLRGLLDDWSRFDPAGEKFRKIHHFCGSQRGFEKFCGEHDWFQTDGNNIRLLKRLRFILCESKNGRKFEDVRSEAFEKHPVKTEALRLHASC